LKQARPSRKSLLCPNAWAGPHIDGGQVVVKKSLNAKQQREWIIMWHVQDKCKSQKMQFSVGKFSAEQKLQLLEAMVSLGKRYASGTSVSDLQGERARILTSVAKNGKREETPPNVDAGLREGQQTCGVQCALLLSLFGIVRCTIQRMCHLCVVRVTCEHMVRRSCCSRAS
jgi:hypothetical protein